jgi:hypothetical protein
MRVLQQAEDWIIAHEAEVARARARVGKRVSLKSERDWYLLQAENMANAEPERILWKRLADELTTRLGDTDAPSEGDETLW